ncbi:hypothetical protein F511_13044 [Dorcoceras hygrometricum]|uniref:Uncharacterized protein n=1 Tax=Dorcoceras hygrometricum TaxID=472368 RepID=A0A2Z7BAI5_9LAMI|nr:hypothetical protein F511_13044 [Dorcoceras hygrometricum]
MDSGSWADQWDNSSDPLSKKKKGSGGDGVAAMFRKKVLGKTKAVASTGVKKVSHVTSVGFQWIKGKCQKNKQ